LCCLTSVRPKFDRNVDSSINAQAEMNTRFVARKALKKDFVCAIGASTGGTEAIKEVVSALPVNAPPVIVAQHIPETYSTSFAKRLDSQSSVTVYEAQHKQKN
jgi:two-component system chemotaxis response regulator CheB